LNLYAGWHNLADHRVPGRGPDGKREQVSEDAGLTTEIKIGAERHAFSSPMLASRRFAGHYVFMTYVTIEAEIADGKIVPPAGAQLPERGRALITILPDQVHRPDWNAVEASLGILHRPNLDSSAWQRKIRAEWES
jgi:hypothetical protein